MPCKCNPKFEISALKKFIYLVLEKSLQTIKNHFEFSIFHFKYTLKTHLQTRENKVLKIVSNAFSFLLKTLNFPLKQFIKFFQFPTHLKLNSLRYFGSGKFISLNLLHTLSFISLFLKNTKNIFLNLFNNRIYFYRLQINFASRAKKLNL
jgi:hypothetical protein